MVVGDDGHPEFAVAHWGFVACELEADQEGHLRFRDQFAAYAFTGQVYQYEPDPLEEAELRRAWGYLKHLEPPEMSERDAAIVAAMTERLAAAAPGRESYAAAVRSASIDLGPGSQTVAEPTHEV